MGIALRLTIAILNSSLRAMRCDTTPSNITLVLAVASGVTKLLQKQSESLLKIIILQLWKLMHSHVDTILCFVSSKERIVV